MKLRSFALAAVAAIMSLSASHSSAAAIQLTNNNFETGTLGGWNTIGSVVATPSSSVITNSNNLWQVNAADTTMAELISEGATIANIEATLGITAGTLQALNTNPEGYQLTNGAALYQSFFGNAGDTLSFFWNFVATDYIPYNDPAYAVLIRTGGGSNVNPLASIYGLGVAVGTEGTSGWQNYTGTLDATGQYILAIITTNDGDEELNSHLFVDGTPGTCIPDCPTNGNVPEPGSLALLGIGLAGIYLRCRLGLKGSEKIRG